MTTYSAPLRPVHAFWARTPLPGNFGDLLTPFLIERITGRPPVYRKPQDGPTLVGAGSILGLAARDSVVWGAGAMRRTDRIHPETRVLAVRGPISREVALRSGASCPAVYGDPGLLLRRFYDRPQPLRYELGIVAHYKDRARAQALFGGRPEVRLIDVLAGVTQVVDAIRSCARIASSSLHGLVAAESYGIPGLWIELGRELTGDGTKFRDYFLSIGQEPYDPVFVSSAADLRTDFGRDALPLDLEPLWEACPFRPDDVRATQG